MGNDAYLPICDCEGRVHVPMRCPKCRPSDLERKPARALAHLRLMIAKRCSKRGEFKELVNSTAARQIGTTVRPAARAVGRQTRAPARNGVAVRKGTPWRRASAHTRWWVGGELLMACSEEVGILNEGPPGLQTKQCRLTASPVRMKRNNTFSVKLKSEPLCRARATRAICSPCRASKEARMRRVRRIVFGKHVVLVVPFLAVMTGSPIGAKGPNFSSLTA